MKESRHAPIPVVDGSHDHVDDFPTFAQPCDGVADGQLVHQGSTQEASTHRAIETVFDQRLRIVRCEERWLALPQ